MPSPPMDELSRDLPRRDRTPTPPPDLMRTPAPYQHRGTGDAYAAYAPHPDDTDTTTAETTPSTHSAPPPLRDRTPTPPRLDRTPAPYQQRGMGVGYAAHLQPPPPPAQAPPHQPTPHRVNPLYQPTLRHQQRQAPNIRTYPEHPCNHYKCNKPEYQSWDYDRQYPYYLLHGPPDWRCTTQYHHYPAPLAIAMKAAQTEVNTNEHCRRWARGSGCNMHPRCPRYHDNSPQSTYDNSCHKFTKERACRIDCAHTHAPFDADDQQTAEKHYNTAPNQPTPLPGAFYHDPLGTWITFIDEYAPDGYGAPPPNTPYYAPLGTPPGTPLSPLQTPTLAPTRTPHRDLRIAPIYNYPLPHPWLNPHEQRQQLIQAGYDPDAPHIAQAHIDYDDHQRPLWYTIQRTWAYSDGTVPTSVTLTSSATRWQPTTTTTTTSSTTQHTEQNQQTQQNAPGSSTDRHAPSQPTPSAEPADSSRPTPPTPAEHQPQARQPQEYSNTTYERTSLYTTPQQPPVHKQPPNTPPSQAHTTPPAATYKIPPTPTTAAPAPAKV